jgi:elongation factor P
MPNLGATEIRKGMIVKYENQLQYVMNVYHHTPGNLRAVIQIKMRNLNTGTSKEIRFSSGDKLEVVHIEQVDMEYLYQEGETYVFMNQENYEQVSLHKSLLGEDVQWLKENTVCKVEFYEGSAIAIEVPFTVELKVTKTEPSLKGATITNVYKPATLETGAVVQVPPFIEEGEIIRVDTREAKYLERANK